MINKLEYSINIKAEKSKIWNALWDDQNYREWTSVFFEGSHAITDHWKEGSRVLFLSPEKDGIYSTIEQHIPNKIMKFKHIGNVVKGVEQPIDDKTKEWTGTTEAYILSEEKDSYTLTVEIDVMDEHLEVMKNAFSKALEIVKKNSIL